MRIIAEGDSWFLYMVGRALIDHLEQKLDINILNLAFPGDEVGGMMSGKQRQRLVRELKKGAAAGKKFEFLLFSGGGNDLVGAETFYKWLLPWVPGTSDLKNTINWTTFNAMLEILSIGYQDVIDIRDQVSPDTVLVFHGYDFAPPNGKGVCGLGPWLEPGLEQRNIPKSYRAEVVKLFLAHFDQWLRGFAASNHNIVVVPTQGTLTPQEWANELHPGNRGFAKIAARFVVSMFGADAPGEGRVELTAGGRARRTVRRHGSSVLGTV
ncbi:MAG: hypothetical protein RL120_00315 [Gammaproteobacteria bacterium]